MMKVFDILRTLTGDLKIINGDFAIGESKLQHQEDIMIAVPGDFKQSPTLGVGLVDFLLDNQDVDDFKTKVQAEFENDSIEIKSFEVDREGNYKIESDYIDKDNNIR